MRDTGLSVGKMCYVWHINGFSGRVLPLFASTECVKLLEDSPLVLKLGF
jgi:hypothetical protein